MTWSMPTGSSISKIASGMLHQPSGKDDSNRQEQAEYLLLSSV